MKRFRKYLAELLIELGFIVMPKFKSKDYLEDLFSGLNVKHEKIQIANADGTALPDNERMSQ